MNRILALAILLGGVAGVGALPACSTVKKVQQKFHCPMHPTYTNDGPGDCPICGMRLVPMASATVTTPEKEMPVEGLAQVMGSDEALRQAGVVVVAAEKRRLSRSIRTVGTVVADETRVRHMHTKIAGFVEKLFVNFTGQAVRKGQPILSIYSQELLASQQEYLQAKVASEKLTGGELHAAVEQTLVAARRRLELFDVSPATIAEIERSHTPARNVTLQAPVAGFVTGKSVYEGQSIEPGMELFTITDLSHLWIEAAVYANEAPLVHVGQHATFKLAFDPEHDLSGKVSFVDPILNPESRTLRVRFDFGNASGKLKPGMFVDAILDLEEREGVAVPDSSIIDTGVRTIVYVQGGQGAFSPRLVKVGLRADGWAQIVSGLDSGDRVAVQGNFLLDSEARIRGAIAPPSQ
jgi:membrane fusion protein, copper/silver efflux system